MAPHSASPYPPVESFKIGPSRAIVLTAGPHPLRYDKSDCGTDAVDRPSFTLDYLRHLGSYQTPLPRNEVLFLGLADFSNRISALRAELEEYLAGLKDAFIKAGALSIEQWRQPKIEWEAANERSDRGDPSEPVDWLL